jgi:hypothetical protein
MGLCDGLVDGDSGLVESAQSGPKLRAAPSKTAAAADTVRDDSEQSLPLAPASGHEEALKAGAIAALAEETLQPPAIVREIFEDQYARLKGTARVTDYLFLLVIRRTRDALAKRSRYGQTSTFRESPK